MIRLLVSVRDAAEARDALEGGADLIDFKEPAQGSLGRCTPAVWRRGCLEVAGRRPISAALGELLADGEVAGVLGAPALTEFQFAKVGLAGCGGLPNWEQRWSAFLRLLPPRVGRVAVSYVDYQRSGSPPPEQVLAAAGRQGCAAILFDTSRKEGALFDHAALHELHRWRQAAGQMGLLTVFAGSLGLRSLGAALRLEPDYVAVRGGVCAGGRSGEVDIELVRAFAERVRASSRPLRAVRSADAG